MKKCVLWIRIFLSLIIVGLIACAATVFWIDPFFQYHAPLDWFPYQIDDQLCQNPGMARNLSYDSIILGSSVTVNFNSEWFDQDFSCHTIKLPYNGAYPKDFANIMEQVDQSGQTLQNVFWGMDLQSFSGETDETKYPIPQHLYDTGLYNDYSYWWNKDVLINYIVKPLFEPEGATKLSEVYDTWELFGYNTWVLMRSYQRPKKESQVYGDDYLIEKAAANIDRNIIPIIEKHPDTQFYIFFPPYCILFWDYYSQLNMLEPMMTLYEYTISRLLAYDNVSLYYFQDEEDIICNLENYTDMIHYSREVNYQIEQRLLTDEYLLTMDNYQEHLLHLREIINQYDFQAVFDEWNVTEQ